MSSLTTRRLSNSFAEAVSQTLRCVGAGRLQTSDDSHHHEYHCDVADAPVVETTFTTGSNNGDAEEEGANSSNSTRRGSKRSRTESFLGLLPNPSASRQALQRCPSCSSIHAGDLECELLQTDEKCELLRVDEAEDEDAELEAEALVIKVDDDDVADFLEEGMEIGVDSPSSMGSSSSSGEFFSAMEDDNDDDDDEDDYDEQMPVGRKDSKVIAIPPPIALANKVTNDSGKGKILDEEERKDEICLICMSPFTLKHPSTPIPCKNKCNQTPVHLKCIYEWKECHKTNNGGSCPLCRGSLGKISYIPRDAIRSHSFDDFFARKNFLLRPIPKEAGVVRCYIRAVRQGFFSTMAYELYLQAPTTLKYPLGSLPDPSGPREGDRLLAVARKRLTTWGCAQLDISMDPSALDFDERGPNYLGSVQSSFSGLEHNVIAPHKKENGEIELVELAAVQYKQNRIRSTVGPRRVQVCLPAVKQIDHTTSRRNDATTKTIKERNPRTCNLRRRRRRHMANDALIFPEMMSQANTGAENIELFGLSHDAMVNHSDDDDDDDSSDGEQVGTNETKKRRQRWATLAYNGYRNGQTLATLLKSKTSSSDIDTDLTSPDSDDAIPVSLVKNDNVIFARNKEPYWLEQIQAYSLDFQGRVTLPSNKNFQLLMEGQSEDVITLQFGKVEERPMFEMYTMDLQFPLSPLQALGICLSACDRKLLCAE